MCIRDRQGRPWWPVDSFRIDDHHVAAGPGDGLTVALEHPLHLAAGLRLFVVGIENSMPVEKDIQRGRDADTALRCDAPEARFEHSGIGSMHLQAHLARATGAPAPLGHLPAEIEYAHAPQAIAADVVLVEGALSAKVGIVDRVSEDTEWRQEVFEGAGLAGGHCRSSHPVPAAGLRSQHDERGLYPVSYTHLTL